MTAVLFPNITSSPYRIELSVAWGADITDLTAASWTWTDITAKVAWDEEPISLIFGRQDESSTTNPSELHCRLLNWDGYFSHGGISVNYPFVRRSTPIRLRVSTDSGSTWLVKFQGNAVGFTPVFDDTSKWATVALFASGPLRQLNQGTLNVVSSMRVGTLADSSVVAYWSLEDSQHSTSAKALLGGSDGTFKTISPATGATVTGTPGEFGSYSAVPSAAPFLTLADGGAADFGLSATTAGAASTTSVIVGNITSVQGTALMAVFTPNGAAVKQWHILYGSDHGDGGVVSGALSIYALNSSSVPAPYAASAVVTKTVNIAFGLLDNTPYEIGLTLTQSGSTTTYDLWVVRISDGTSLHFSGTVGSNSNGAQVNHLQLGVYYASGGVAFGHLVVRNAALTVGADVAWLCAHPAEAFDTRLSRLCTLVGLPLQIYTTTATETSANPIDAMGYQYVDTISNSLREIEATQQGLLFDGLNNGLGFTTRGRRVSQAATITLDATAGGVTVADPVDDEEGAVNDVTVSRRQGGNATYQDITGPLGVNVVGDYQESYTVNPNTDDPLDELAQWYVHLGTQQGYRYPTVSFDLHFQPSLIASWLAMIPSGRFDVTNLGTLRPQLQGAGPLRLVCEGWTETITPYEWFVTANTTRWEGWNVGTLAAATGSTSDSVMRRDTDGSAVNTAASVGATSVSVKLTATGKPLWVTGTGDDFPFYADIGGNVVQVTGISGSSSPQTFTLASPGLPYAVAVNAPVRLWNPPVLGV